MSPSPRLLFMGTPAFAVPPLQRLVEEGYDIVGVYTQPPRPKNRGHHVTKSPVHLVAESYNLPVYAPMSLKSLEAQEAFARHEADLAIVVAYGLILPKIILNIPRLGCINIHGSLLPRWRGAAPIHRAMLAGDSKTGITLMHMDEGLDTGDMIKMKEHPLSLQDTFQGVHDAMSILGAQLLIEALPAILKGHAPRTKQPDDGVTYAHKLSKEEGLLDWTKSAENILRCVNTLNPWPGTMTMHQGHILKIKRVSMVEGAHDKGAPGTILPTGFVVCGDGGVISLDVLQREGGKPLSKEDFLRGYTLDGAFSV